MGIYEVTEKSEKTKQDGVDIHHGMPILKNLVEELLH